MKAAVIRSAEDRITPAAVADSATSVVDSKAVLVVVRSGILKHTLPVAISDVPVALNQDLKALVPAAGVAAEYAAWVLRAHEIEILRTCTKAGTTVQSVEMPRLLDFIVPIAPLAEQYRIVAAIEEHLSRLDAAVEGLKRLVTLVSNYRASVLLAAFDGRLTGRAVGSQHLSPEPWLFDAGLHSAEHLPAPAGWAMVPLQHLVGSAGYGSSQKCDYDADGPPMLRIPNVVAGRIDLSDLKYAHHEPPGTSAALEPGDMLIVRTNGSRALIGRAAVVERPFERAHFFASYLIRLRLQPDRVLWRWISRWWESPRARVALTAMAATSAGQYNISLSKLNTLRVPIPPKLLGSQILAEVDRHLSQADFVSRTAAAALKRAQHSRQSILNQAFEGRLVPQDKSDEAASVLLDRIRESQVPLPSKPKKKRSA